MSKFVLQESACKSSGVSVTETEEAIQLEPSLFQLLGEKGFEELSTLFYDRVFGDTDSGWFLSIFASSSKAEAIENQVRIDYETEYSVDVLLAADNTMLYYIEK